MLSSTKRGARQPSTQPQAHAAAQEITQGRNIQKGCGQKRWHPAAAAQTNLATNTSNILRHNHIAHRTSGVCLLNTTWTKSRPTAQITLLVCAVSSQLIAFHFPYSTLSACPAHRVAAGRFGYSNTLDSKVKDSHCVVEGSPTLRAASLTRAA